MPGKCRAQAFCEGGTWGGKRSRAAWLIGGQRAHPLVNFISCFDKSLSGDSAMRSSFSTTRKLIKAELEADWRWIGHSSQLFVRW